MKRTRSVTTSAVVVSFMLLSTACSAEPSQPAAEASASTSPATTAASAAPQVAKTTEELINEKKIPSGLSAEDYAGMLLETRVPEWILGGSDEAYWDEATAVYREPDDKTIETRIAEEQSNIYANALFVPGWRSVPGLVNVNESYTSNNTNTKIDWLRAHDFDGSLGTPDWDEGMVVELTEVREESEDGRTIFVAGYQTNNASETSNPSSINAKNNGAAWNFTITTTVLDGHEYVSNWTN